MIAETRQAVSDLRQRSCEGLEANQRSQPEELLEQLSDLFAARDEDCMHTSQVKHNIDTKGAHPIHLGCP